MERRPSNLIVHKNLIFLPKFFITPHKHILHICQIRNISKRVGLSFCSKNSSVRGKEDITYKFAREFENDLNGQGRAYNAYTSILLKTSLFSELCARNSLSTTDALYNFLLLF